MPAGKYSPTVVSAYRKNQKWFSEYSRGNQYDPDGYDMYGYNSQDRDRAGFHEDDYWLDSLSNDSGADLAFSVQVRWGFEGIKPVNLTK